MNDYPYITQESYCLIPFKTNSDIMPLQKYVIMSYACAGLTWYVTVVVVQWGEGNVGIYDREK